MLISQFISNQRLSRTLLILGFILGFILGASGCTSMTSTLYTYDGCQNCERVKKHLHGVPTTLEVPTHLDVKVVRSRFGKIDPATGLVVFQPELETREVCVKPVCQKEIFTVDFKRPAAGKLKYTLTFDQTQQYIKEFNNQVDDQTIAKVTSLITTILKTIPPATGRVTQLTTPGTQMAEFKDVIASELFAIGEPNLEDRVQAFFDYYVNQCHPTCPNCPIPGPTPCAATGCGAGCAAGCGHHP